MKDARDISPLRLHWWKATPNFGDALSPMIVGHLAGRKVVHAKPVEAEMFALGSLLQVVKRKFAEAPETGARPVIWGTGLLGAVAPDFLANVEVALVRGPVTAALLQIETDRFGDPGLLVDRVLPPTQPRTDRIGIVPHHSLADSAALKALVADHPRLTLIDPRADATEVCAQIAACAHVFASSLHGLIVADAYGVANTWVAPEGQSRLKYLDYAASVGRDMATPVALSDIPALLGGLPDPDAPLPYQVGIDRCRTALHDSFPGRFAAVPATEAAS